MIYYCQSTGGFYEDLVNKQGIPADKVEINGAYRLELLRGQALGRRIAPDEHGYPVLMDVQPPSEQELRALALVQRDALAKDASALIATLQDAVDLDEATAEEQSALIEWKRYRIGLMRLDQQAGFPQQIEWPLKPEADSIN